MNLLFRYLAIIALSYFVAELLFALNRFRHIHKQIKSISFSFNDITFAIYMKKIYDIEGEKPAFIFYTYLSSKNVLLPLNIKIRFDMIKQIEIEETFTTPFIPSSLEEMAEKNLIAYLDKERELMFLEDELESNMEVNND